ncbi:MAG: hypothetical protein RL404_2075 [Pseudomonadota bacterium]
MNDLRPDPDRLLDSLRAQQRAATRGKLRLFFGACAGVGKTYAMLQAARQRQAEGVDVLVGVAETHGRADTGALLDGLRTLPPKSIDYRGHQFDEFDLDTALECKPQLIVVDELAHSNVAGSRHQKRWQDIDELLGAGIDVYTTLNVQHIDSLNDVVGSITGVRVRETVPDRVFDLADDVTLVDLPVDELLLRLRQGKVYVQDAAQRAAGNFFRKGNLIALREIALRRTADRVDAQMREYRADQAISNVWQAKERLLVCVGNDNGAENLVRAAARLASRLQADWIAVHVTTPATERSDQKQRSQLNATLQLAERLGGESVMLSSSDAVLALVNYARTRNASRLVLGHRVIPAWRRKWLPGLADHLAQHAPQLDLLLVGVGDNTSRLNPGPLEAGPIPWLSYLKASTAIGIAGLIASLLLSYFELANIVMVFLLAVVLAAMRYGRGPGAWAALLAVVSFDFFFVPPRLSLSVHDTQYLFTFVLMLIVALIIGQLTAKLRFEAEAARQREQYSSQLARLARLLSGALTREQIVSLALEELEPALNAHCWLLLPDSREQLHSDGANAAVDLSIAQWVFDHAQPAGRGTSTLPSAMAHYYPLSAPTRTRGTLVLMPADEAQLQDGDWQRHRDACAAQIALALERIHFVDIAQEALLSMEGERLRNSVLAAVSHDLRTPLTSLVGIADMLEAAENNSEQRRELLDALREKAHSTAGLVGKLLDMARLQSGTLSLKREWHSLEEIVGSARRQLEETFASHRLETHLPSQLPLCEVDAVLIERVIVNLLENAVKYTPTGSTIAISASVSDGRLAVAIEDNGPGFPEGQEERLFHKFERGEHEGSLPGVGLGLAICRAIVEAHGGQIHAERSAMGGARIVFTLPMGTPPAIEQETEETI